MRRGVMSLLIRFRSSKDSKGVEHHRNHEAEKPEAYRQVV
jgi:hypothetical protein